SVPAQLCAGRKIGNHGACGGYRACQRYRRHTAQAHCPEREECRDDRPAFGKMRAYGPDQIITRAVACTAGNQEKRPPEPETPARVMERGRAGDCRFAWDCRRRAVLSRSSAADLQTG